jgi:hypothetical protein
LPVDGKAHLDHQWKEESEESGVIEHAGCSWRSEDRKTSVARERFVESAAFHDAHGDDLTKCGSWLCVCGDSDTRGSWETTDRQGKPVEPTAEWLGFLKCVSCGRVYDNGGVVVSGPGATLS